MCLIARNSKAFRSSKLKNRLYTYDKSDPKNIKFPEFIENITDSRLYEVVPKFVDKYKENDNKFKNREELNDEKGWNDLEILLLIKFYKNGWSFIIPREEDFFPHFVFTYNIEPLKKEIDKIVSRIHDKIEPTDTVDQLVNRFKYTNLDVTYLLHYFVITHPDYSQE